MLLEAKRLENAGNITLPKSIGTILTSIAVCNAAK